MIRGNLSDQVLGSSVALGENPWKARVYARRLAAAITCAVLGFVGACCLIRLLIPAPINLYAEIRSEKIALAKQWASVASVAAFGSSHVDCGFDPRSFDESLAPGSVRPISINLGVLGGIHIEQAAVAREYLRLAAASPSSRDTHILLMEINTNVNFNNRMMTHPRSIYIYDLDAVRLAFRFSDPKLGAVRAVGRSAVALFGFVLNFMNVGMLSDRMFEPPLNHAILDNQSVADRRGLSPPSAPPTAEENQNLHALMAGLKPSPTAVAAELTTVGLCSEATSLLPRVGTSNGYHLIYIVTPKLSDLRSYNTYPDTITCGTLRVPIINVALPLAHPELYDPALWHDITHLTERGAGVYSALLAQAVKQTLDTKTLAAL
jgi:hypothetical protein